jgi:hypothetical protein
MRFLVALCNPGGGLCDWLHQQGHFGRCEWPRGTARQTNRHVHPAAETWQLPSLSTGSHSCGHVGRQGRQLPGVCFWCAITHGLSACCCNTAGGLGWCVGVSACHNITFCHLSAGGTMTPPHVSFPACQLTQCLLSCLSAHTHGWLCCLFGSLLSLRVYLSVMG